MKGESTSASSSGSQSIDDNFSKELRGDCQGKRKDSLSVIFLFINVKVDGLRHIIWEGILDMILEDFLRNVPSYSWLGPCRGLQDLGENSQDTVWSRCQHLFIFTSGAWAFHATILQSLFPTAWLSLRPDIEELKEAWVQGQLEIITYNQRTQKSSRNSRVRCSAWLDYKRHLDRGNWA